MENLDSVTIFWLIAMGMIVGAAMKAAFGRRGVSLITNVALGVFGTVTVGGLGILIQLPGSMLFGLLGSISVLFLANVFHMIPEEGH